jgi:hypothetical protein
VEQEENRRRLKSGRIKEEKIKAWKRKREED